jgi:hypothetical protein
MARLIFTLLPAMLLAGCATTQWAQDSEQLVIQGVLTTFDVLLSVFGF